MLSVPPTDYMIPLVCSVLGFIGLLLILLLVLCHYRHLAGSSRSCHHQSSYRRHSFPPDMKTNNENEDNQRRYRNSLFDSDKGGGSPSPTSSIIDQKSPETELLEFDLEKYEKSPQQHGGSSKRLDRRNDTRTNNSPLKHIKKKNINIELSRLQSEREGIV